MEKSTFLLLTSAIIITQYQSVHSFCTFDLCELECDCTYAKVYCYKLPPLNIIYNSVKTTLQSLFILNDNDVAIHLANKVVFDSLFKEVFLPFDIVTSKDKVIVKNNDESNNKIKNKKLDSDKTTINSDWSLKEREFVHTSNDSLFHSTDLNSGLTQMHSTLDVTSQRFIVEITATDSTLTEAFTTSMLPLKTVVSLSGDNEHNRWLLIGLPTLVCLVAAGLILSCLLIKIRRRNTFAGSERNFDSEDDEVAVKLSNIENTPSNVE